MSQNSYDAFISYRHTPHDKAIAIKLQRLLENYRPPKSNSYANKSKIDRIFRDESELPTSGDLGADIQKALEQSAYLIVICSEETSKSQWCMEEIDYFKQLHSGNCNNILTLLVSGNPREVFPKSLCYETKVLTLEDGETIEKTVEIEPLAANIVSHSTKEAKKKLNTEFLRIAAPILGCSYDDLYQRHQRRFIRNFVLSAATIISLLLMFSIYVFTNARLLQAQSRQILEKQQELEQTNNELNENKNKIEEINTALEKKNEELQEQIEETTKQKNIANQQTTIAEVNEQKAIDNLALANEQKTLAEQNAAEAKHQEQLALENLNLAEEQKVLAIQNADEAKRQEQNAIANQKQAEENLELATKEKNKALSSQSQYLASISIEQAEKGDRMAAMMLALEGLPKNLDDPERPYEKTAEDALRNAIYTFDFTLGDNRKGFIYNTVLHHNDMIETCTGLTQSRLYTISSDQVRLWNTETGALLDQLTIDLKNDTNTVASYDRPNSILLHQRYYDQENYYSQDANSIVTLIRKNTKNIEVVYTASQTRNLLLSSYGDYAIVVNEAGFPELLNLKDTTVTTLKNCTNEFIRLNNTNYDLAGDINDNGSLLALYDEGNSMIRVISISTGKLQGSITANKLRSVHFLSDNSLLYYTDTGIYHYHEGKTDFITDAYYSILINNKEQLLYADYSDITHPITLHLVSLLTGEEKSAVLKNVSIGSITVSPDGKYVAISEDGLPVSYVIDLDHLSSGYQVGTDMSEVLKDYSHVVFSPDSKYFIYYNASDSPIVMYETATQGYVGMLTKIPGSTTHEASFLSKDKMAFIQSDNSVSIVDMKKPEQVSYFQGELWSQAYFADNAGDTIYSNDRFGNVLRYDTKTGEVLSKLDYLVDLERSTLRENDAVLITSSDQGDIPYYTINDDAYQINWNYDQILDSQISLDGNRFLLRSEERIVVYDIEKDKMYSVPNLHDAFKIQNHFLRY
ncbi:MAG: hypothetical protein K0S47_4180 [Herbinix sp.]|nr:hypothetical protein [Herbinix sp.]